MGCVSKVTPLLDQAVGAGNWEVDIQHVAKELTVVAEEVQAETVQTAVGKAGFKAELITHNS